MQIRLLTFAHVADAAGFRERLLECTPAETPREIVLRAVPKLQIDGLRVAIDEEYGEWDAPIGEAREIAIIPPVSGG